MTKPLHKQLVNKQYKAYWFNKNYILLYGKIKNFFEIEDNENFEAQ